MMRLPAALFILLAALAPGGAVAQAGCSVPANAARAAASVSGLVNNLRAGQRLGALQPSEQLAAAARTHACDAARTGRISHTGSDGSDVRGRVRRAGYRGCQWAENMAFNHRSPDQVVTDWAGSPGHRRNMLMAEVQDFGVGVAIGANGPVWVLVLAGEC